MSQSCDTERLALRLFTSADAGEAYGAITPSLTRFMGWEPPPTAEAFSEIWRGWTTDADAGTDFHFTIRLAATGEFLGLAGLHRRDVATPELGIWIKETAHRRGYGSEAVRAVIAWASQRFAPAAFLYPVAIDNTASRRIAEGLNGMFQSRRSHTKFEEIVYLVPAV